MEESVIIYDTVKNNPKSLLLLIGKYMKINLIKNVSSCGFIHAIDPEEHSIILLEPSGETFQTILLPGHAILDLIEINPEPGIKPPITNICETNCTDLSEKKQRLISWLQQNLLPVTEVEDNIMIGNVTILPPYNVSNIYSTNVTVTKQVKDIINKMPEKFGEI